MVALILLLGILAHQAVSRVDEPAPSAGAIEGGEIDYWPEEDGPRSFAAATAPEFAARFRPLFADETVVRRGPHWLRLTLPNRQSHAATVVLEFTNLYLDDVTAHVSAAAGIPRQAARTGQALPIAARSVRSHLPAVNIVLPAGVATTVWIRAGGRFDEPGDVKVWPSPEAFRRHEQKQVLALSLYLGLWGALLVYNAFVFVMLRDRLALWYAGYVAAVGALAAVGTNFSAHFFAGLSGAGREALVFALLMLAGIGLVCFSRAFLETRRVVPTLDGGLRLLLGLNVAGLLLSPAVFYGESQNVVGRALYLLAIVTLGAVLGAGVLAWIRRAALAPLFVLAFGAFIGGLGWMILAQINVLPPDHTNGAPFLIGSGLELLLLGIAVAYRYRIIRDEKEQLQASYATSLERDVAARTRALEVANADKDRLISVVAHDVRAPLTSLLAVSQALAREPAQRPAQEVAADARAIEQRTAGLLALIDNLLEWGRLRTGHTVHAPADLNLAGLAEHALAPLGATAAAKGVRLTQPIPAELTVRADGHAVESVLRNLVGNAIKFTPAGGEIAVTAERLGEWIEVRVADTGIGIAPERLAKLFRPAGPGEAGTAGEKGAGVGLALCRELIEREGGTLKIDNGQARGVVARFTVRASAAS